MGHRRVLSWRNVFAEGRTPLPPMTFLISLHRLRWLHAPTVLLVLFLQRGPGPRLAAALASPDFALRCGDLLRSAFALAALGAFDSVAGATTAHASPVPPTTAAPTSAGVGKTFNVTGAIDDPFGVSFTVSGAPRTVHSWKVSGAMPPGVSVADGFVSASGAFVVNGLRLSLTGIPGTAGSYPLTLSAYENNNAGGRSASVTCRITIAGPSPPAFIIPPLSQTVIAGGSVTFTAELSGSPVPSLQWFKGDTALDGETSAALVLTDVQPADAGDYALVATNPSAPEGVRSPSGTLTVHVAPVLTAAPAATLTASVGESLALAVTASGNPAPTYQWRKGSVVLSGETGPELALGPLTFADAGTYTVVVANAAGTRSAATRLLVPLPAPAEIVDPGTLKTGSAVTFDLSGGQPVPAGLTYKASGLPAGLALDPATGLITGVIKARPGPVKIVTSVQAGALKGPVRTASLTIGAFPAALVGKYEALLETPAEPPLPAGKLTVAVSAAGTFSGTLLTEDRPGRAVKGRLVLGPDNTWATASLSIPRPAPLPAYALTFRLGATDPVFVATLATDIGPLASADDGARLLVALPASTTGRHTMLLSPSIDLGATEAPLGITHATAILSAKGALTFAGKQADGTKLTASLALGTDRVARLYLKPYKLAGGYLAGPLPFTSRADDPARWHVSALDGAGLFWRKPIPAAATTNYPEGFGPLALIARIEPWTKPSLSTPLPPLLGLGPSGEFGLALVAEGLVNVEGNPDGLPLVLRFDATKNRFTAPGADPSAFSARLNAATGALDGSFTLKAQPPATTPRKVTFTGVVLQPAPADLPGLFAGGFFLLSAPAKGGPALSGQVGFSTP